MTAIIDCLIAWISFENSCTQLINDLHFRLPIQLLDCTHIDRHSLFPGIYGITITKCYHAQQDTAVFSLLLLIVVICPFALYIVDFTAFCCR